MKFIVRKNSKYLDVVVVHDQTKIDLGLHDDQERKKLAKILLKAAEELLVGLENSTP